MKGIYPLCTALFVVAGCSSVSVHRDYDPSVPYSTLATYAWEHEQQPETGNPRVDNDLLDQRIRNAIEAELKAKGYTLETQGDADFLVAYYLQYKQRIQGSSVGFGLGGDPYGHYGGLGYNTVISDYDEGQLTIDIVDRATKKTVWRGVGIRSTFEGRSPEKVTRIVNKTIERILAEFPPED